MVALRRWFERPVGGSWGDDAGAGEQDALCIRGTDLVFGELEIDVESAPLRGFTTEDVRRRSLRVGDIVIEKSGGGSTQPVGRVGLFRTSVPAIPTNFAARLRPRSHVDPRFACYQLASLYFAGRTMAAVKQTTGIQNLDIEELLTNRAWLPPFAEQRAIADHLDAETARIDALIANKQQLIHLLEERAVSAAEWLVAERAATYTSLKRAARFFTDGDWIESPFITDQGIRLIQTGNIGRGGFRNQGQRYISNETFAALHCTEVYPGDVLISRLANTVGQACVAPGLGTRMVTSVDVVILRPRPDFDSGFLVEWLSTPRHLERARLDARGTTMQRLARSQVGELPVPVLPLDDQREIGAKSAESRRIHRRTIERASRQVDLLAEHRRALITAAVIGATSADLCGGAV